MTRKAPQKAAGRWAATAVAALVVLLALPSLAAAAPGAPDATFGTGGLALVSGAAVTQGTGAPLVQSDGRIVDVALEGSTDRPAVVLARFTAAGSPDSTFGPAGRIATGLKAPLRAVAGALAPDDRIVVATGSSTPADITVSRFTSGGAVDKTFNKTGQATLHLPGPSAVPTGALVQPDGAVLVTVLARVTGQYGLTVVRFTRSGTLDTAFGAGKGYVQVLFPKSAAAFALTLLSDGRIVLAGGTLDSANNPVDTALARLRGDGSLDPTFGTGGRVTQDLSSGGQADGAFGITPLATGGFFVTGPSGGTGMVARFTATGALDSSFGTGGLVLGGLSAPGTRLAPTGVTLDGSGRVAITGRESDATNATASSKWVVTRLQAAGASPLDGTFGSGGVAELSLCANHALNGPTGIAPASSDRLLIGGTCNDSARAAVVRLVGGVPFPDGVALAISPGSGDAGHERISLANLDPSAVLPAGTALQATPLRSGPLRSGPLRSGPLRSGPLRSGPLRSGPLRSGAIASHILLSELPLQPPNSWDQVLQGTSLAGVPLQTITLQQVFDLDPPALAHLTMDDVDLSHTPLKDVSWAAILLYPVPVNALPAPSGGWDSLLNGRDGDTTTLLDLELAGIDLSDYYSHGIALAHVPFGSGDQRALLADVKLVDVDLSATPLGAIPASQVSSLLNCGSSCTGTLASQQAADPVHFSDADLGQLIGTLPLAGTLPDVTLGQVLLGLIDVSQIPFEQAKLRDLLDAADIRSSGLQDYATTFRADCGETPGLQVGLHLPGDARVVPGSATVSIDGGSPQHVADPAGTSPAVFDLSAVCAAPGSPIHQAVLHVSVEPGSTLGPDQASVDLGATGAPSVGDTQPTVVQDDAPSAPPVLGAGEIRTGHISSAGDVDTYTVPAPAPGSLVTITLAHLPADYDLVVDGPPIDDQVANARSSPLRSGAFPPLTVPDTTFDPTDPTQVAPNAVQDLPLRSGDVRGLSIKRGTQDESVTILSREGDQGQDYTVKVSGFAGASSPDPYVIRAAVTPAPPSPGCAARPDLSGPAHGDLPGDIPDTTQTLVLIDEQRMEALYPGQLSGLESAFTDAPSGGGPSYLQRPEVQGELVPVDGDAGVRDAYAAWDASPCAVNRANDVVRAINGVVDGLRAANGGLPDLKNIEIVGPDIAIPQMRIPDQSALANENTFADDMVLGTDDNAVSAALREGNLLTDDPYGDFDPQSLGTRQLYIPDVALGRLVETPADIEQALTSYRQADGVIHPNTGFVAGYDFTKDGSQVTFDGLKPLFGNDPSALQSQINDTWDAATGLQGFNTSPGTFSAVNGHFDTYRAMPALTFSGGSAELMDTTEVHPDPQTLLFTIGCHAGLNVDADGIVGAPPSDPRYLDWAQKVAGSGALWIANTGYGLGDSDTVAYSEKLLGTFGQLIGQQDSTLGQALMFAKQDYAATALGVLDDYDYKALQEATFYGLPTYTTPNGTPAQPAAVGNTATRAARQALSATDGPLSQTFDFEATGSHAFQLHHDSSTPSRGDWYTVGGEDPLVIQNHPIEPRTTIDVTPSDNQPVHGAIVDQLAMDTHSPFDPVIARPIVDLSAHEPEPAGAGGDFPASLAAVQPLAEPDGQHDQLTLNAGQFQDGAQRLFTTMQGRTFRSSSTDWDAPRIADVEAVVDSGAVSFAVDTPDNDAAGGVVLYRAAGGSADPNVWHSVPLAPAGNRLGATDDLPSGADHVVEWLAQIYDQAGNVSISTNKAVGYQALPVPPPNPGAPQVQLSPADNPGGSYSSPPTIDLQANGHPGPFQDSLDGGAYQDFSGPFTPGALADGLHLVDFRGADGSTAEATFIIDHDPPLITGSPTTAPNQFGWYSGDVDVHFTCADAGSGIASCGPDQTVTGEGANLTASGTAVDKAGRSASTTVGPIQIDRTPPDEVTIDSTDGNLVLKPGDQVTGRADDQLSGIESVLVTYTNPSQTITQRVSCTPTDKGDCRWTAPPPPHGDWTAVATARDLAGNTADSSPVHVAFPVPPSLIVDGSFEQADVPTGSFGLFTGIPGWTWAPGLGTRPGTGMEIQDHIAGDPAPSGGDQFLELDGDAPAIVYQDVDTVKDQPYELDFLWSPRPGVGDADNHFRLRAIPHAGDSDTDDGSAEFGPTAGGASTDWRPGQLRFTATSSVTRIQFTDLGPTQAEGGVGAYVDEVSMVPVSGSGG